MSDLIERKEAIEAIKKYGKDAISAETAEQMIIKALMDCMIKHKGMHEVSDAVLDALHNVPAVDAVPVVRKHCDFCGRGKPIKAFTTLPDCGLQYGTSIMATYCPKCGAKMNGEGDAK